MKARLDCTRCGGRMAEGFVTDEGYGVVAVGKWIAGAPVKSWWSGVKTWRKPKYSVQTYRCERCGLLESYAPNLD